MYERIKGYFNDFMKKDVKGLPQKKVLKRKRKWITLENKKENTFVNYNKVLEEEENRKIAEIRKNNIVRIQNNLKINDILKKEITSKIKLEQEKLETLYMALEIKAENSKLGMMLFGLLAFIAMTAVYYIIGDSIVAGCILDLMAFITCGMHFRKIDDMEQQFKQKYPNDKELLLEKKKSLKKSLNSTVYQLGFHKSQQHKIERKNYRLVQSNMYISKEQYRNVEKVKELSSSAKKPPLSMEELKKYREMLVSYQNNTSLQCDKMNGVLQNNGIYNEVIYDYTIHGVQKTKCLDKIMK